MARKNEAVMPEIEDVELGDKTRVEVWTDRFLVVGDVHAQHSIRGTRDRLSALLNQSEKPFLPLTDVVLYSLGKKRLWRGEFLIVNKSSVVLVKALKE